MKNVIVYASTDRYAAAALREAAKEIGQGNIESARGGTRATQSKEES